MCNSRGLLTELLTRDKKYSLSPLNALTKVVASERGKSQWLQEINYAELHIDPVPTGELMGDPCISIAFSVCLYCLWFLFN